jgi:hypothetical protein
MERHKVLIATKTYPSISRTYQETVCTAGILLDDNENPLQWIRIYPIRFRLLELDKKFPRWSIISARIERNPKDYREESYRIDDTSISILRQLVTWDEKKAFVVPFQFSSLTQIQQENKSLGLIKPLKIDKYFCEESEREWSPRQQSIIDQTDLLEPNKSDIEKIPFKFGYRFTASDGKKHKCSISDWEILQLYRNCRNRSKATSSRGREEEAIEKVRQKLEDDFLRNKDLHFIMGNLKNHKNSFMIIGLFYPPFQPQLTLFDL